MLKIKRAYQGKTDSDGIRIYVDRLWAPGDSYCVGWIILRLRPLSWLRLLTCAVCAECGIGNGIKHGKLDLRKSVPEVLYYF